MKKKIFLLFFPLLLVSLGLFIHSGCNYFTTDKISEGEIKYEISYPNSQDNFMTSIMPSEMKLEFKDNNTYAEMSGGLGMFSAAYSTNPTSKTLVQLVKIMNKKFAHVFDNKGIKDLFSEYPKINIEYVNETKEIAGYKCKKAIITIPDENLKFDVYYTRDIQIKNPNWYMPYREIDGVLMEYQIKKYNIEMKLVAKSVSDVEIKDDVFQVPTDYKKISKQEMDEMFLNFN